jgi:DNA-binding GntR family transcriptional regulator
LHFVRMTDITTAERLRATCEQHLKILVCIKYSTADCARESLRLNIEGGHSNVEHAIKEALARSYMGHRSDA